MITTKMTATAINKSRRNRTFFSPSTAKAKRSDDDDENRLSEKSERHQARGRRRWRWAGVGQELQMIRELTKSPTRLFCQPEKRGISLLAHAKNCVKMMTLSEKLIAIERQIKSCVPRFQFGGRECESI